MYGDIILYTTFCRRCEVLEKKLKSKNIPFKIETDVSEIINMGFMSAPVLDNNGTFMEFDEAVKWVNKQ